MRLSTAVLVSALSISAGAQPAPTLRTAQAPLKEGDYRSAESAFLSVFRSQSTAAVRAEAMFGRAFAMQQRVLAGDTLDTPSLIDSVDAGYRWALQADSMRWRTSIYNNRALLHSALGRHDSAAILLGRATRTASVNDPSRPTYWVNLGREYEALNKSDSAIAAYTAALRVDRRRVDAARGLLSLLARTASAARVIAEARTRAADSATAPAAVGALITLLGRQSPRVEDSSAATALVALARAIPVARVAPEFFSVSLASRLASAASLHPSLEEPVQSLVAVMTPVAAPAALRSNWWESYDRRLAWSTLLRWVGDTYNESDNVPMARHFYEAAIGGPADGDMPIHRNVDRTALLPLAVLYSRSAEDERKLDRLVNSMFNAKGVSYANNDLPAIRDFHLTLGAIYAARGKWSGDGARNAEFQIEHLRRVSKQIARQTGRPVSTPPDLLEQLAVQYKRTNRLGLAEDVKKEVEAHYFERKRPLEGAEAVKRIELGIMRPPPA